MKILVFDIWGDLGHFRKFYTTTSPLSFSFPPPSS
ncbi:MAG: CRISPR-associated protein Cas5, partial [bacterium]